MNKDDRRVRSQMEKLRQEEIHMEKKLRRDLEQLQALCGKWGFKFAYHLEELPTVRRKAGYAVQDHNWDRDQCPRCKNCTRIYYLYQEIKPWHKITDFQCGRCGHEWRHTDNTYD